MRKVAFAAAVVASILVGGLWAATVRGQQDPFLTVFYGDDENVLCRDYQTANGARFATYQCWLLGFVSGAGHVSNVMNRPLARSDVARILALAADHCRAKPTDTLASAAVAIVEKLVSEQSRK